MAKNLIKNAGEKKVGKEVLPKAKLNERRQNLVRPTLRDSNRQAKLPEDLKVYEEARIRLREMSNSRGTLKNGTAEFRLSPFEKIDMVEKGISKKALENLKQEAGLDYDQLSKVLNVARTTLLNKKGEEKFNSDVSDKILGLADIYSYGYEVFEDRDRFNEWIFRANKALGGQAPFDILHNSFGREEVKHLIGRIDHGVYS